MNPTTPPATAPRLSPPSLDPLETPEQPLPASLLLDGPTLPDDLLDSGPPLYPHLAWPFEHTGWHAARLQTYNALIATAAPTATLRRFALCSTAYWILASKTTPGAYTLVPDRCKSRWCQPCAAHRAAIIRSRFENLLPVTPLRLMTLTITATDEHLSDQIDRLYRDFRKLRRRPLFQSHVSGFAAVLEITRNPDTHTWHPHLHVLFDGLYIEHAELKAEWLACTGDSYIVWLSRVNNRTAAVRYVTKYITKTAPHELYHDPEALQELITACQHRRLIVTGGTWSHWQLVRSPKNDEYTLVKHERELDLSRDLDAQFFYAITERRALAPNTSAPFELQIPLVTLADTS